MALLTRNRTTIGLVRICCAVTLASTQIAVAENSDRSADACIDPSITFGERIVWSLHRGTSKSARELSCESEMAVRLIYSELDHQYFQQGDIDSNYRVQHTIGEKSYADRAKLKSNVNTTNEFGLGQTKTKTSEASNKNKKENLINTLPSYQTLTPSVK